MEEDTITNLEDVSKKDLKALQKKPVTRPSTLTSEWPLLLASQTSQESTLPDIPSGQKTPVAPVSWTTTKKEKLRTVWKGQSREVYSLLQRYRDTSHSEIGRRNRTKDSVQHSHGLEEQETGGNKEKHLRGAFEICRPTWAPMAT